jgi:predicted permease
MKLIDNWKESGKLWSIRAAIALVLANLFMALLAIYQVHIPATLYATLNALGGAAIALLRILTQDIDGATDSKL